MLNTTPLNDDEFVAGTYFKSMYYTLGKLYSSQKAMEEQRGLVPTLFATFYREIGAQMKEKDG